MERIIRVLTVFGITTAVGLFSIMIANGDLTWATFGLVLIIALIAVFGYAIWYIVHNKFKPMIEAAIVAAIVLAAIAIIVLAGTAGNEIWDELKKVVAAESAWWLVSPIAGTIAITSAFGLHRSRGRR